MNLTKDLKTFIMLYGKLTTSCADFERKFSKISAAKSVKQSAYPQYLQNLRFTNI